MQSAAILNTMPPFYKGLSMGEMGLLVLVCTVPIAVLGAVLAWQYDSIMLLLTGLILGPLSAFGLPNAVMHKLSRLKTHHCQHYASLRWDRFCHHQRYQCHSERFANRRS